MIMSGRKVKCETYSGQLPACRPTRLLRKGVTSELFGAAAPMYFGPPVEFLATESLELARIHKFYTDMAEKCKTKGGAKIRKTATKKVTKPKEKFPEKNTSVKNAPKRKRDNKIKTSKPKLNKRRKIGNAEEGNSPKDESVS